jgi:methyltransferase (TIGR00027 family)
VRGDRPSLTASCVAAVRALYAAMPAPYNVAPDPEAADLVSPLFALPARAVARAPWAVTAVHRALGAASFGLTHHVALRTAAIDDALREALAQGPRQVVLLGAGLDNRAERMRELDRSAVFEVDHPNMQRLKRARRSIAGAGSRRVTLVPVDFERDRLDQSLLDAGFAASEPSFWIWEGVTIYLTPDAISETLRAIAVLSPPGSRLAITYTRPNEPPSGEMGERGLEAWVIPPARALAGLVGEPVRGMVSREEIERRLNDAGFAVLSDESAADWVPRYWPGQAAGRREWERLAVAERARGAG